MPQELYFTPKCRPLSTCRSEERLHISSLVTESRVIDAALTRKWNAIMEMCKCGK